MTFDPLALFKSDSIARPEIPREWFEPSNLHSFHSLNDILGLEKDDLIELIDSGLPFSTGSSRINLIDVGFMKGELYGITSIESKHVVPLTFSKLDNLGGYDWWMTAALEIEAARKYDLNFNPNTGRLTIFGKDVRRDSLNDQIQRMDEAQDYIRKEKLGLRVGTLAEDKYTITARPLVR